MKIVSYIGLLALAVGALTVPASAQSGSSCVLGGVMGAGFNPNLAPPQ